MQLLNIGWKQDAQFHLLQILDCMSLHEIPAGMIQVEARLMPYPAPIILNQILHCPGMTSPIPIWVALALSTFMAAHYTPPGIA